MSDKKMTKKNKMILISGISVAFVTLIAIIISSFITRKAPDPKLLGPKKQITYMASKQFARLPEQEKTKYIQKIGHPRKIRKQLTDNERKAVFKNIRKVMQKKMKERIKKFAQMSEDEQNDLLDKIIAERNKRRRDREAQGNTGDHKNRNAFRQGIFENTDSTTRAQMADFRRRIQERENQTH
jgi:hypothetical protein